MHKNRVVLFLEQLIGGFPFGQDKPTINELVQEDDLSTDTASSAGEEVLHDTAENTESNNARPSWFTDAEDKQMSKARTVYVFKSADDLRDALRTDPENKKQPQPISGAVLEENGNPVFYVIHKIKGGNSRYGWYRVSFDDSNGSWHCGSWYAPITLEIDGRKPPRDMMDLTNKAKMSAVAIPLRYFVYEGHPDGHKCCVTTNWWKERDSLGNYDFHDLDYNLHP